MFFIIKNKTVQFMYVMQIGLLFVLEIIYSTNKSTFKNLVIQALD